jgi:hypothetical protein
VAALLDAVAAEKIDRTWLGETRVERLIDHPNEKIRGRARQLFSAPGK